MQTKMVTHAHSYGGRELLPANNIKEAVRIVLMTVYEFHVKKTKIENHKGTARFHWLSKEIHVSIYFPYGWSWKIYGF